MGKLVAEELGFEPCECTLQRVMKEYGLNAQIRRVRKVKPHAGKAYQAQLPNNTLNREFRAEQPLHRMVTDVTYIPYYENNEWHWGFLSLVQDLFDRSIVAWRFAKKQDNHLGVSTLCILASRGLAPGATLHSDRGSIYTSKVFRDLLSDMRVNHSFSREGNCHDNATMESFNETLKIESLYNSMFNRQEQPSFKEQNALIGRYIEYYNNHRPCSILGNMTPKNYRAQYEAKIHAMA